MAWGIQSDLAVYCVPRPCPCRLISSLYEVIQITRRRLSVRSCQLLNIRICNSLLCHKPNHDLKLSSIQPHRFKPLTIKAYNVP
jgi:hypothetical protein